MVTLPETGEEDEGGDSVDEEEEEEGKKSEFEGRRRRGGQGDEDEEGEDEEDEDADADARANAKDGERKGIEVMTDLDQMRLEKEEEEQDQEEDKDAAADSDSDTSTPASPPPTPSESLLARQKWSLLRASTLPLARRLCEKLRLVLAPLVASKLQGDYRAGKRLNMKRVVGYVASGYRKDKIWLRRTKPNKRDYRVLVAVDDSESMSRGGGGGMALEALAVLAGGMSQLEVGEFAVGRFGERFEILREFGEGGLTEEAGGRMLGGFGFNQRRTNTARCVESAVECLEGGGGANANGGGEELRGRKLCFLISDGRIERDSRERLRKLNRDMTEKGILLVVIIVEKGGKESIVNVKEVGFVDGKPKMKAFIEGYPFPFYLLLSDMKALPDVLGDSLKQWFEMVGRLN